ncbi:MAG: universal stress protein [Burkholderiales bacterium]|nr:universal stress protein [Burkholderiales bacterium]
MYKHLLVPIDGSKLSLKAVTYAVDLAKATGGRVTLMHVVPEYPMQVYAEGMSVGMVSRRDYAKAMKEEATKLLDRTAAKVKGVEVATMQAANNSPWEAILAGAKKAKADTIVMASHGRRGLASLLLGSETTKVLTHSKLPVLVVR